MAIPRRALLLAIAAGALARVQAPAAAEPHRWSLSIAAPFTGVLPAASYKPIGADNDYDVGIRLTLAREDLPFALRLEAQSLGGGERFPDTLATVHGEPVPSARPVVYNRETYWTVGLEWTPRADATWGYVFLGAGGFRLTGDVQGDALDMVVPDAPMLPKNRLQLCVVGGAGGRVFFDRKRHHMAFLESSWFHAGPANWVATPAVRSDLGHTMFPVKRSSIDALLLTVGYAYAIHWGGPHEKRPRDPRGWRRFLPKRD